jgi:hypothetical protein
MGNSSAPVCPVHGSMTPARRKTGPGGEIQHLTHGQTGSYKPAVLRVGEVQREGGVDVVVSFAVGITGRKDGINFERDETDAKPQKTKWPSNGCAALTD